MTREEMIDKYIAEYMMPGEFVVWAAVQPFFGCPPYVERKIVNRHDLTMYQGVNYFDIQRAMGRPSACFKTKKQAEDYLKNKFDIK